MQTLDTVDIAFITETWLTDFTGETTNTIKGYGFNILRTDRGGRGGGIAVIHKNIGSKLQLFEDLQFFENLFLKIQFC